ncbi:LacI family DNA-binding transcriptional regulator [Pediococcus ethanolidurans]|uniref:LacI family transcriptional regulator n=1 Tax=Pediococcus ethanolidurans TaxID=319653 RepID=A0A0R2K649_9LACO|nr:LacI family DNA-binding transcriptional regulator [Pediococcus ethanolidurans]KRN81661.1 hypothetical protein IV87_GL001026 [Pediococcus ethanolidurans]MDV7719298.1 LacI family DNA-binding transcriptional regulator [Pediococcus ethanolidurans]GEN95813.1 LacI family transcriptional regulator [Pediococcus ethanolidurans]SER85738.1 LacI family transcriptional regulator [Pediococcus ethanolidurans]
MANIKEIASKAKVSISTVSRVLNYDDTLSVTEETRKKVFQVAEELNYTKYKHKNDDQQIAVIEWYTEEQELHDSYYMAIRLGTEKALLESGLKSVRLFVDSDWNLARRMKGVIAIGRFSSEQIQELKSINSNLIIIGQDTLPQTVSCVVTDAATSMENLLRRFIEKKLTKIGIFIGNGRTSDDKEKIYDNRLKIFRDFLRNKNLYDPDYVYSGPITPDGGYEVVKYMLSQKNKDVPNALFVASDTMAVGVLKGLREAKINVPNQISIVSFNDSPTAEFAYPALSSVRVYTDQMGKRGVSMLKELLNDSILKEVPERIVISTNVVYRDSSL